jgi:hypothetical protein
MSLFEKMVRLAQAHPRLNKSVLEDSISYLMMMKIKKNQETNNSSSNHKKQEAKNRGNNHPQYGDQFML